MAFIKATETAKVSTHKVWKITKVNNEIIFTQTINPFGVVYENGYIDIIDIFGRHFLINTRQCIDMLETTATKVVNDHNLTEWYEGTPEVRTNYTCSDNYAKPITENNYKNICG